MLPASRDHSARDALAGATAARPRASSAAAAASRRRVWRTMVGNPAGRAEFWRSGAPPSEAAEGSTGSGGGFRSLSWDERCGGGFRPGLLGRSDAMSTPDSGSRAAELAAQQVESIVEAAQQAAEEMQADAERKLEQQRAALEAEFASRKHKLEEEIGKLRADATAQADKELKEAQEEATRKLEQALAEATRMADEAQGQANERVAAAEKAADEALADARAISGGLRRLGQSLEEYAERILRDVQAGHKRLRGDLRIASGGPASPSESLRASRRAAEPESPRAAEESARADAGS